MEDFELNEDAMFQLSDRYSAHSIIKRDGGKLHKHFFLNPVKTFTELKMSVQAAGGPRTFYLRFRESAIGKSLEPIPCFTGSLGVDFTKLCLPSKKTPAHSVRQKMRHSISPTIASLIQHGILS